jgi:hypothetical protein
LNLYPYVSNNPVNQIDPEGLFAPAAGALVYPPAWVLIPTGVALYCAINQQGCRDIVDGIRDAIRDKCSDDPGDDGKNCTEASRYQLAKANITDPHAFKEEFVGRRFSRYDICACKDGSIKIAGHGQCGMSGPKIETGLRWK